MSQARETIGEIIASAAAYAAKNGGTTEEIIALRLQSLRVQVERDAIARSPERTAAMRAAAEAACQESDWHRGAAIGLVADRMEVYRGTAEDFVSAVFSAAAVRR